MSEESILESAIVLHSAGFPVILTDEFKNPGFVGDWPNFIWTAKKFASWLQRKPDLQLGLKLWPVVDIEIDAPAGDDGSFLKAAIGELHELAGFALTPSWTSRRGRHWLFQVNPEQRDQLERLECPSVLKVGRLEVRMGCGKAAQSLIPPSTTDNFKRAWVDRIIDNPILSMPDKMFQVLRADAAARLVKHKTETVAPVLERPGDVYNESATWDEILIPYGWKPIEGADHEVRHWTRPGKTQGVSATTGFCKSTLRNDCFYAFSTADEIAPFESQRSYSKFEAFTLLEFAGDFSLASAELAKRGFTPELPGGEEFEPLPPAETKVAKAPTAKPPKPPKPPVAASELPDFVYNNPIGKYVLANDPHTEADRDSVLLQSWELFGNWIGKEVTFKLNNSTIYPNGYLAIVGKTALGRKGTALQDALAPYRFDEPELDGYLKNRVRSGISSGEGIIALVADSPSFTDGRLMIPIQEFHRLMTVLKRTDSTLSSVLREAYDGGMLSVATRVNPLVATAAHVSMIVHTTAAEFVESVDNIDIFNGVLNRVLFFLAADGKTLPNPGQVDTVVLEELSKHLVACREWADNNGAGRQLYWSEDSAIRWSDYYRTLRVSTGDPLSDAVLARANTHVIKMAMRHSALGQSEAIQLKHLESAIAIWEQCRVCANSLMVKQNPLTDERQRILDSIRDNGGQTKTELMKLFGNNKKAQEITDNLEYLQTRGLVVETRQKRAQRTVPVWSLTV